jgi:hypothetical protein
MGAEENRPIIYSQDQAVVIRPDGDPLVVGDIYADRPVTDTQLVDHLVETRGLDPDGIVIERDDQKDEGRARRTGFVAFSESRWNSPWDPRAENAHNN